MSKDDPINFAMEKATASLEPGKPPQVDPAIKLEIFNAIQRDMVPATIALEVNLNALASRTTLSF